MSQREKMFGSIQTMVPCKTKLAGVMPLWRACCRLNCPESLKFNQFQLVILGILGEFFFYFCLRYRLDFSCILVWNWLPKEAWFTRWRSRGITPRENKIYIYFANIPMTLSLQIPNCNLKHWWNFKGFKS